jgi:hypothetical protein
MIRTPPKERPGGLYRLSAYYLARIGADIPIELLNTVGVGTARSHQSRQMTRQDSRLRGVRQRRPQQTRGSSSPEAGSSRR